MAEKRSAQAPRHESFIVIPNMPCPSRSLPDRQKARELLSGTQFAFPSNVCCYLRLEMLNMQYSRCNMKHSTLHSNSLLLIQTSHLSDQRYATKVPPYLFSCDDTSPCPASLPFQRFRYVTESLYRQALPSSRLETPSGWKVG